MPADDQSTTQRIDPGPPRLADPARTADEIRSFIRTVVSNAGCDGVVVILDGGLSATVTATLAVEALDPAAVYGLVLPADDTPEADVADAQRLAHALAIDFRTVDVEPLYRTFERTIVADQHVDPWPDHPSSPGTATVDPMAGRTDVESALGNVTARLRMVAAYFEANTRNRLVLGAGNRTDYLLGAGTKHGENAVDYRPIGDCYETQVRDLAHHLDCADRDVQGTSQDDHRSSDSDGPRFGPTANVDTALHLLVDRGKDPDTVAEALAVEIGVVDELANRWAQATHKRTRPPTPGLDPATE